MLLGLCSGTSWNWLVVACDLFLGGSDLGDGGGIEIAGCCAGVVAVGLDIGGAAGLGVCIAAAVAVRGGDVLSES